MQEGFSKDVAQVFFMIYANLMHKSSEFNRLFSVFAISLSPLAVALLSKTFLFSCNQSLPLTHLSANSSPELYLNYMGLDAVIIMLYRTL